jgi:CheY-like chemotaxis protein
MVEKSFSNEKACRNHKPYGLVILDNHMPIMSGIETAKRLRENFLEFEQHIDVSKQGKRRGGEAFQKMKIALLSGERIL